ncbi:MAG: hypothetical protein J7K21_04800 [Desulfurococcales archaeon]|nr:hypothetical protein [Desulfurococcales archaeon]
MVESKQMLYSLAAGLIAGVIASIVIFIKIGGMVNEFMFELVYNQLLATGLSGDKALEIANQTIEGIKPIYWLIPISPIINMLFISAILGILLDFLVNRLHLKPYTASILTGLTLILLLQLTPIIILGKLYGGWITELLDKYIGLPVILTPSIIYTTLLTIFNTIKGPWNKWGETKPEIY